MLKPAQSSWFQEPNRVQQNRYEYITKALMSGKISNFRRLKIESVYQAFSQPTGIIWIFTSRSMVHPLQLC